jgi:hypothetical protein
MEWMILPTLLSRMFPRLYDFRSFVLNAFHSIGSVLRVKIVVEITPAMTGRFVSMITAS